MEYSVSTLKTNTIQAATGTTVSIASGNKISGDAGAIVVPGQVLQVQSALKTDHFSSSSTSFVDVTGLTVDITPSSTSSKVLVTAHLGAVSGGGAHAQLFGFARDSTVIGQSTSSATTLAGFGQYHGNNAAHFTPMSFQMLDSPNTTSQVTYKVQFKTTGSTTYLNRWASNDSQFGTSSSISVMEIAQ